MDLQPQMLVDSLVGEHAIALAHLHRDLHEAILESATRWADRFGDPAKLGGLTRAATVRQTLLHMDADRAPIPGSTLSMHEGNGQSVMLLDKAGNIIRVRKYPSNLLNQRHREVATPPPGQREAAAELLAELTLDDGCDEPVFNLAPVLLRLKLYVFWWLDAEQLGLAGAELAAVAVDTIDDSKLVRILATAPLPAPAPILASTSTDTGQSPLFDDFGEFGDDAAQTGDDPA
ncbi:hypothetical protein [Nocardia sp. NPDC050435]|uniref:hypothetical protein n=1 Tax=Nocardia sp. NPDC050435 TaxID=3155040 RepID=UPI00340AFDD7